MSTRTSPWPAGVPCWADLSTPDIEAAKAFYAAVVDWTYTDHGPEYGNYNIAEVGGKATAGIGPMQAEAPPSWTLYMASDNADTTAAAIREHGGTVLMEPDDVGSMGRMLIAADPTGGVFGVWQAKDTIGAEHVNEPGGLTWEDLRSTDPDAARNFYVAVFGYTTEPLEMAGPDYTTFALPGNEKEPLGGMGGMMGADGVPPHWLVYFGVQDADAAVAAAESGGGSIIAPPFDTPYGKMAGLADPAGAMFWIVETPGSEQPDHSG